MKAQFLQNIISQKPQGLQLGQQANPTINPTVMKKPEMPEIVVQPPKEKQ